jgi:hypothetical protein
MKSAMESVDNSNPLVGFPINQPNHQIYHHGWFLETHIRVFRAIIQPTTKIIFELGSWYGSSTRWLVENSDAKVFAIDLWDDGFILNDNHYNSSHELRSMLRSHPLYETFLKNLWEYKDRVTPLRMKTLDGLQYLFDQGTVILLKVFLLSLCLLAPVCFLGIKPDIIYIDADHHYDAAKKDILKSLELFPDAIIVGDDYGNYEDVRRAVHECANEFMKTGLSSHTSLPFPPHFSLLPLSLTVHVDNNHCWTYCCLTSPTGHNIAPKNTGQGKFSNLMNR